LYCPENLRNIAEDYNISHTEVAMAANLLFQNGDILAEISNDEDDIAGHQVRYDQVRYEGYPSPLASLTEGEDDNKQNLQISDSLIPKFKAKKSAILTLSEIEANLEGKFGACYYLTSEGGTKWESVAHPDWNRYHTHLLGCGPGEISESEIICPNRQFVEKFLSVDCYVCAVVHIPGTEVWDVLSPWKATYWKTLSRGYRVLYQSKQSDWHIDLDTSPEWIKANDRANKWYGTFQQWYKDPDFD
jgi:hypothetical protein